MIRRAPWSLRRRLVLGVTVLLAVLAVVIGVVSVAVLNDNLMNRLDRQLESSAQRFGNFPGGDDGDNGGTMPSAPRFLPGQGQGAIRVDVVGGTVSSEGVLDENSGLQPLTTAQLKTLLSVPQDGTPHTVSLGKLGSYRVIAQTPSNGTTVIAGLSTADVTATTDQLIIIIAIVTLLALVLAVVLGLVVVGVGLRPLTRVASTATRVSELPMEAGEVFVTVRVPEADSVPTTEVGRVGAALNRLLERVQSALTARNASEAKLRRFVADASHELRTPLASIRGYAELSQRLDADLPPDVQRSLERIGSESIRMTALVEDLLLLARLDSGDHLRSEPVELPRLLVDSVSDAHAAAPDHIWELDAPDEDIRVLGDADRLHQVVANLLANARTHTPSGTRVVVELSATEDEVAIGVRDNGPGIPPELLPNLFERFVRGDSSRSRNAGSTGLGLSIASAIVDAHGGRIAVVSEPGDTLFTVTLPRDPFVD